MRKIDDVGRMMRLPVHETFRMTSISPWESTVRGGSVLCRVVSCRTGVTDLCAALNCATVTCIVLCLCVFLRNGTKLSQRRGTGNRL